MLRTFVLEQLLIISTQDSSSKLTRKQKSDELLLNACRENAPYRRATKTSKGEKFPNHWLSRWELVTLCTKLQGLWSVLAQNPFQFSKQVISQWELFQSQKPKKASAKKRLEKWNRENVAEEKDQPKSLHKQKTQVYKHSKIIWNPFQSRISWQKLFKERHLQKDEIHPHPEDTRELASESWVAFECVKRSRRAQDKRTKKSICHAFQSLLRIFDCSQLWLKKIHIWNIWTGKAQEDSKTDITHARLEPKKLNQKPLICPIRAESLPTYEVEIPAKRTWNQTFTDWLKVFLPGTYVV